MTLEWFAVIDYTRRDPAVLWRGTSPALAAGYHKLGTVMGRSYTSADMAEFMAMERAAEARQRHGISEINYRTKKGQWDDGVYLGGDDILDGLLQWRGDSLSNFGQ